MPSIKVALISTSVLSAAVMLKISAPAITDFVDHVPSIYNDVVSWMKPPYLYLLVNCIIITIVASSKLQSMKDDDVSPSTAVQPVDAMVVVQPHPLEAPIAAAKSMGTDYLTAEYKYNGIGSSDLSGYEVKAEKGLEFVSYEDADAKNEEAQVVVRGDDGGGAFGKDATSNKENEYVIPKSTWTVPDNRGLAENSPSIVKPPVSGRFGHRRNVKASPEGGKQVLGVSKPKRNETLESTWRTITEGRGIPITRHLRKSDTWERGNHLQRRGQDRTPQKTMTKSETFTDRTNTRSPSPGKIRRDASPSQDELNRRVEAFIKKFNEEMRLQRQESLNQYMEMVSSGSR